jgi:MHS family citrate/tricarballylate:H+ symporter-like MFS transporter
MLSRSATLQIQIGHTFFPTSNGLLLTLATFASASSRDRSAASSSAAMGDRVGREPAMLWSFGLAIVGFAVIPSYSQIGMAALVLLVIFRLLQGFAVGGEVGPSTAYLIEYAPQNRRGLNVAALTSAILGEHRRSHGSAGDR